MVDNRVLRAGTVIGGRYDVGEKLGQGGFAVTYKATDRQLLNQPRVIKALHVERLSDVRAVDLFKREVEVLLSLDHKRIPKVHALIEEGDRLFLVEDFIEGVALKHQIAEGRGLPETRVRDILDQLLDVLQYLHAQRPPIIHRDIKPDNIIVQPDGGVVLIDFGGVRLDGMPTGTGTGVISSPGYTSIEQMNGRPTPASDIYSLGATTLHLISGVEPLKWSNAQTNRLDFEGKLPTCSAQLANIIQKMVADPRDRFESAVAVRHVLLGPGTVDSPAAPGGQSTDAEAKAMGEPHTLVPRAKEKSLIRRFWLPIAAAAVVVMLAVAIGRRDSNGESVKPARDSISVAADSVKRFVKTKQVVAPTTVQRPPTVAKDTESRGPMVVTTTAPRVSAVTPSVAPEPMIPASTPKETISLAPKPETPANTVKQEEQVTPPPAPVSPRVDHCAGIDRCYDAGSFTVRVKSLTPSQTKYGYIDRTILLSFIIKNESGSPIVLSYRAASGTLVDDQGNRYENDRNAVRRVRGIGLSNGRTADPQFGLAPGEERPITLEYYRRFGAGEIFGITYSYEFTLDALTVKGAVTQVARTSLVSFDHLTEPQRGKAFEFDNGSSVIPDDEPRAGEEVEGPFVPPTAEWSAGESYKAVEPACWKSTRLSVCVNRIWKYRPANSPGGQYFVKVSLRARNDTSAPIALAYVDGSGALTDDQGNRYANDRTAGLKSVHGIPTVLSSHGPPFVIDSGSAREFILSYSLQVPSTAIVGTTFSYDLTLREMEVLSNGQTRAVRDLALDFTDLVPVIVPKPIKGADTVTLRDGRLMAKVDKASEQVVEFSNVTDHIVTIQMTLTNTSDQPVVLGYRDDSMRLTDNQGFRYEARSRPQCAIVGIGISQGQNNAVSTPLVLRPGQRSSVKFASSVQVPKGGRIGNTFDFDLVFDQFEETPSRQLRLVRTSAMSFHDFGMSGLSLLGGSIVVRSGAASQSGC